MLRPFQPRKCALENQTHTERTLSLSLKVAEIEQQTKDLLDKSPTRFNISIYSIEKDLFFVALPLDERRWLCLAEQILSFLAKGCALSNLRWEAEPLEKGVELSESQRLSAHQTAEPENTNLSKMCRY